MIGQFPWDPFPPDVPLPRGPDPLQAHAYREAIAAADAYRGVREALRIEHDLLRIGNRFVPRERYHEVAFVAVGNAAGSMALGAADSLGELLTAGFAAGPPATLEHVPFPRIEVPLGLPIAPRSEEVVRSLEEIAETLHDDHLLVLLLSPGALPALARPPTGWSATDFGEFLARIHRLGATGEEIDLATRTMAAGGVGGGVARALGSVDVATLVVDRGDGARRTGGGPMHAVDPTERAQLRATLERLGVRASLPEPIRAALAPDPSTPAPRPTHRPVYVARPADALTGAGDALFDRKWRVRLGTLALAGNPEDAAEAFLLRVEEILAKEPAPSLDKSRWIAVLAAARLDEPEGAEGGPALARFLTRTRTSMRRPELSVGLFRTAGPLGGPELPGGAVIGRAESTEYPIHPGRARAIPMEAGVTDVGFLAIALWPGGEDAPGPAP